MRGAKAGGGHSVTNETNPVEQTVENVKSEHAPVPHSQRFVVLLSHERSGSHYVTDMLVSTGQIQSFDEICNFKAVDPETAAASFFRYRRTAQARDSDILLRPSPEAMARLLDGYLCHLSRVGRPGKKLLIDIKYGHVHNFEIGWCPSERRPFLLGWLASQGIPVVHLTRRNSLASAISNLIAEKTNIWHRKEDAAEKPSARIPVQRAVHEALLVEREKDNFFNWLMGVPNVAIEYEQVAGEKAVRDAAMTRACGFLGLAPPAEFRSSHHKVTAPLAQAVQNYEELARCVHLFGNGRLKLED
jgi:LPS sulfotransferase NodH